VADPHRAGHELTYHPGEANLRMADVVVINKIDTADLAQTSKVRNNVAKVVPDAIIIDAASPILVDNPAAIRGKRVLVIEDGPTLTHGEMAYGAGIVAARRFGAAEIIDPRPYAVGSIAETFKKYPATGPLLPAMGYGRQQIEDLQATINATPCEMVIAATPVDLRHVLKDLHHPIERVDYELQEIGRPTLADVLSDWLKKMGK
jgi:predicted GTPase